MTRLSAVIGGGDVAVLRNVEKFGREVGVVTVWGSRSEPCELSKEVDPVLADGTGGEVMRSVESELLSDEWFANGARIAC